MESGTTKPIGKRDTILALKSVNQTRWKSWLGTLWPISRLLCIGTGGLTKKAQTAVSVPLKSLRWSNSVVMGTGQLEVSNSRCAIGQNIHFPPSSHQITPVLWNFGQQSDPFEGRNLGNPEKIMEIPTLKASQNSKSMFKSWDHRLKIYENKSSQVLQESFHDQIGSTNPAGWFLSDCMNFQGSYFFEWETDVVYQSIFLHCPRLRLKKRPSCSPPNRLVSHRQFFGIKNLKWNSGDLQ